jgi:hypothetical protein
VWKVELAPRIQPFLWFLSNNKLMTVDNLKKVNVTKPEEFVLCSEKESVNHLFFECVVAKFMWSLASDFLKRDWR